MEKEEKSGNKKVRLSREEILSVNSNFLKSKIMEIDLVLEEYAEKFWIVCFELLVLYIVIYMIEYRYLGLA